jgi:hypothetical protein
MSYHLVCNVPPETDGSCTSQSWLPISDLSHITMTDANNLITFAVTGFLLAIAFRWAIRMLMK